MKGEPIDPRDYEEVVRQRKLMKQDALNNAMNDPACAGYAALLGSCSMAQFIDDLNDYDDHYQEEDDIRPF